MNILLTGATGFIGRNLLKELLRDNRVSLITRESTVQSLIPAGVEQFVFKGDIKRLKEFILEKQIEGVVHLA